LQHLWCLTAAVVLLMLGFKPLDREQIAAAVLLQIAEGQGGNQSCCVNAMLGGFT
jgi:hypothetical protein